jgi:hypothetical protein
MSVPRCVRRSLSVALCLSFFAVPGAFAQAQTAAQGEFAPQVGQEGKDVVWVPTPQALVDTMLDMAQVTPQDFVMDLGSGDGRTVITAAKRGATAMGIEYNADMVALSRTNAAKAGVADKATFVQADLFQTDYSKATVITMFLLTSINMKLRPVLLDLKPGTRIVSNSFGMGTWEPDESRTVSKDCTSWCTAMLWIIPAKVEGTWRTATGDLTLKQEFQTVSGTLGSTQITDARLRGDQITFKAGDAEYQGRVSGNAIMGTVKTKGSSNNWSANRGK